MAHLRKFSVLPTLCAGLLVANAGQFAHAADLAATTPPPPASWWDTVTVSGAIEGGYTANPDYPGDGLNFGHLLTDKANKPLLNQALLTVQRPLDPKSTDWDLGFRVQFMYGSDARYTRYLGQFDYLINDWSQFTPVEAWGVVHVPLFYSGGIDVKFGQYATLEGAEVISAGDNYLYSHSYIFNFGVPLVHTGIMTISHVDPMIDIYAGVDTGVNTTFGNRQGDNNGAIAFHGGLGLNLLDGALTIMATTHIGPENPDTVATALACNCNPNKALRYLSDITAIWKATESLTFITDLNYIQDNGFRASGYGVAQYAIYAVNDWLKLVGRAEVWRDQNNFFVAAFPGNFDFVNIQYGFPNTAIFGPSPTTYLELTAGLNITPPLPEGLPLVKSIVLRPEIRYDSSLNGTPAFNGQGYPNFGIGTKTSQFTFGGDVIVKF